MNRKQLESKAYSKPNVAVCLLQTEQLLTFASGQHQDAENGGSYGNAKQGWFDEEEEEFTPSAEEKWNE